MAESLYEANQMVSTKSLKATSHDRQHLTMVTANLEGQNNFKFTETVLFFVWLIPPTTICICFLLYSESIFAFSGKVQRGQVF